MFRDIAKTFEINRDDSEAFDRAAHAMLGKALLAGLPLEAGKRADMRIRELAQTIPVKLISSKEVSEATDICRQTAQRLKAGPGFAELIRTWPAPIAHEIRELVRILDGDGSNAPSPEAALMQLRDVTEMLVKLPASVLVSRLLELGGADANEMRQRLSKVSGGAWIDLARTAAERLQLIEPAGPYAKLAALFADGKDSRNNDRRYRDAVAALWEARNTYLGHGAMRQNRKETAEIVRWVAVGQTGDANPLRDQRPKSTLFDVFEIGQQAHPWADLRLEALAEDGSTIDLTGGFSLDRWLEDPRHVHHNDRALVIRLVQDNGVVLKLSPLVAARICRECGKRDVFFFDAVYDRKKWQVDFLDYGRGHKSRFKGHEAADIKGELLKLAEIQRDDVPPVVADGSLESGAAIAGLDRLRVDLRYLSPAYLREPFTSYLKQHDRGIYWLQAPAHIGKTMFVLGLSDERLNDDPIHSKLHRHAGGGIAAFLCKREYREGGWRAFLNYLSERLRFALDLRSDLNAEFPEPNEVIRAVDKRRAFVAWLDKWRTLTGRADRPLLIVIDGLDEADPPSSGESLIDLLPKASELTPGLYFLLTSRRIGDADCPPWLGPAIEPLASQSRRLDLNDKKYLDLLSDYVFKELDPKALDPSTTRHKKIEKEIEGWLDQADSRFSFLSFIVEQVRGGEPLDTLGKYGKDEQMYDHFIDTLEVRYGPKRGDVLLDVLASLAAAEMAHAWIFGEGAVRDEATGGILEPLPSDWLGLDLKVLAAATALDERQSDGSLALSISFIEVLIVLQGSLRVWRGQQRDTRYGLGLKDFANRFKSRRPEAVRRASLWLATLCLQAVEMFSEEPTIVAEDTLRSLFPLLPGLVELSGDQHLREEFAQLPVIESAFGIASKYERASWKITWFSAILAALAHGAGEAHGDVDGKSNFAAAYGYRGAEKVYTLGYGPTAAIADFNEAIALLEARYLMQRADLPANLLMFLFDAYANRGNAKRSARGFTEADAIVDFDRAIALFEGVDAQKFGMYFAGALTHIYNVRGNSKKNAPEYGLGAALTDYDLAIALQEALCEAMGDEWPINWRKDLANAYKYRGDAKAAQPDCRSTDAVADYDRAIALFNDVWNMTGFDGNLELFTNVSSAYSGRAVAKMSAPGGGPAAAIADLDLAIALQETLRKFSGDDWSIADRNALAIDHLERGKAKRNAGLDTSAVFYDYERAIELIEALRNSMGDDWPIPWRNVLISAYMNRADDKVYDHNYGPVTAIDDYDRAMELQQTLREEMGENWTIAQRYELAYTYFQRGHARAFARNYGPAAIIDDYDHAIALHESLRKLLGEEWPIARSLQLADEYMKRGIAKSHAHGYDSAAVIDDYECAIALLETFRDSMSGEWPIAERYKLADAYLRCGKVKMSTPKHGLDGAITDCDRSIALLSGVEEPISDDWTMKLYEVAARAYSIRAAAKTSTPGYGPASAISDYDELIAHLIAFQKSLRATMGDSQSSSGQIELAGAYLDRGKAKDAAGYNPAHAIGDYDQAIALQEALRDSMGDGWSSAQRDQLAYAYTVRGSAKANDPQNEPAAAIADYDLAIALQESLRNAMGDKWPINWRNDLADSYMNRGIFKACDPGGEPAAGIPDLDSAITLQESVHNSMGDLWPIARRNELANAYLNRGRVKETATDYGSTTAISDYNQAIALLAETQLDELGCQLMNQLTSALNANGA